MTSSNRQITTYFSPILVSTEERNEDYISVVVDILRATTTICTAVYYGATIVPVATLQEINQAKQQGYPIAGERLEKGFENADFGNSAMEFMTERINGIEIVQSTTNGTKAIMKALEQKPKEILIGSFSNISALSSYLVKQNCNVEIICSGWRNNFCLEDSVFAGSLASRLFNEGFTTLDDSTYASHYLWKEAEKDMWAYLEKAKHIHKLRKHHLDDVFPYTFTLDTCPIVPKVFLEDNKWKIRKAK